MALLPIPDRQVHAWEVEVVGDSNGAMASYHTRNESNTSACTIFYFC